MRTSQGPSPGRRASVPSHRLPSARSGRPAPVWPAPPPQSYAKCQVWLWHCIIPRVRHSCHARCQHAPGSAASAHLLKSAVLCAAKQGRCVQPLRACSRISATVLSALTWNQGQEVLLTERRSRCRCSRFVSSSSSLKHKQDACKGINNNDTHLENGACSLQLNISRCFSLCRVIIGGRLPLP